MNDWLGKQSLSGDCAFLLVQRPCNKGRVSSKSYVQVLLVGLSAAAEQECSSGEEGSFFPGIPDIKYAGPDSKDLFSYRYYNAEEVILGKPMKDWLRFSVAFWYALTSTTLI